MIDREAERLLAAGAMLDDLAPDERLHYATHRAGCGECLVLEGELGMVLADLALVVPERLPPPGLLDGIRRAIDAERGASAEPRPAADPSRTGDRPSTVLPLGVAQRRSPRRPLVASLALAAALAVVAVGLGVRGLALQGDLDRSTAALIALQDEVAGQGAVVSAVANPGRVTVALHAEPLAPDATAVVVFVPGTDQAYLVAEHLPPTPQGEAYQLWFADAAGVHGLAAHAYDGDGAFVAPLGVDLAHGTAVMVTLEPAGGATGDPGPQVVFGEL